MEAISFLGSISTEYHVSMAKNVTSLLPISIRDYQVTIFGTLDYIKDSKIAMRWIVVAHLYGCGF